jgi:hypothetical protein
LTLDDPLIVLLFYLREVFVVGAVSLRVGALADEFILGVRKVLFFHQEIRVLGLAEGGVYDTFAEFAALKGVRLLGGDHDGRFFISVMEMELAASTGILVFDLNS